jgi:acyl carrier protein
MVVDHDRREEALRREDIQAWLVAAVAKKLRTEPEKIDVKVRVTDYGLDSIEVVSLSGDLELFLEEKVSPTLVWDYPTIDLMARHLAGEVIPPTNEP